MTLAGVSTCSLANHLLPDLPREQEEEGIEVMPKAAEAASAIVVDRETSRGVRPSQSSMHWVLPMLVARALVESMSVCR